MIALNGLGQTTPMNKNTVHWMWSAPHLHPQNGVIPLCEA